MSRINFYGLITIFNLLIIAQGAYSQKIISGVVFDRDSKDAIENVNISDKNGEVLGKSNSEGRFQLLINN